MAGDGWRWLEVAGGRGDSFAIDRYEYTTYFTRYHVGILGKKLLGKDVSKDDPISDGRDSVGVTGEQGGRLLACYLVKMELSGDDAAYKV